jgi:hypothetical protein
MLRSGEPIELQFRSAQSTPYEAGINLSTGLATWPHTATTNQDLGYWTIPFKCRVLEAGITIKTGLAGANPASHTDDVIHKGIDFMFDVRKTAGSDTGRGDGDAGKIWLNETGASAQGDYVYDLVGQTPYVTTTGAGCSLLEPGMEVVFQTGASVLYGAGCAGVIVPHLLVEYIPEVRGNMTNASETS